MATITANLNAGDGITPDNELIFKIYGDADAYTTAIATTGSAINDANVSVNAGVLTIANVDAGASENLKITSIDASGNESVQSNAFVVPVLNLLYQNSIFHADYEEEVLYMKDSVGYENIELSGTAWNRGVLGKIDNTVNLPTGADSTNRLKTLLIPLLAGATSLTFRTWFKTTASGFKAMSYIGLFGIRLVNGEVNFLTSGANQTTMNGTFNDGNWHRLVLNFPVSGLTSDFEVYVDNTILTFKTDPTQIVPVPNAGGATLYMADNNSQQWDGELDSTTIDKNKNFTLQEVSDDWNNGDGVKYIDTTMQGTYDIWLAAGQSNSVGLAAFNNVNTLADLQDGINNGAFNFNNSFIVKDYRLFQTGFYNDGSNYFKTFSDAPEDESYAFNDVALNVLASLKSNKQLLCKAAVGGTPLFNTINSRNWNVDYASIPDPANRLTQILNIKFDRLIAYLTLNNIPYNIKGVLWHQGETDAGIDPSAPGQYAQNFANFVAEVRSFTGVPDLPIIYGTISVNSAAYNLTIRNAQLDFATNDANAYCRDNNDLTLYDGVHFDQVSTNTFGEWVKDTIINNNI